MRPSPLQQPKTTITQMNKAIVVASFFGIASSSYGATLIGSLHAQTVETLDQQSFSGVPTRTSTGDADTIGTVAGSISIMSGQEIGTSSYNGIDLRPFTGVTQYSELNRFASSTAGGLILWDFNLSTALSGISVGSAAGESSFSLDVEFQGRATAQDGLWFISYNGGGLTLDNTDITTHTISGATSGNENFDLVSDTALYSPILSLTTATGDESVDLTSQISDIASGDGLIRIAYLERNFRGDILLLGESGIVQTVNVPEPSSSLLMALAALGLTARRRRA